MAVSEQIAAITKLYSDWRAAVTNADIPGYVRVLHDDVTLMPPGADDIVGASQYAKFLGPVFESATYEIEVISPPSVEVLGEVAVARYEYVIHLKLKNPDQGITEPGALTASRSAARATSMCSGAIPTATGWYGGIPGAQAPATRARRASWSIGVSV